MRSRALFVGGLAAIALAAAACTGAGGGAIYGSGAPSAGPTSSPSAGPVSSPVASPTIPAASGTVIAVGSTRLGQILVDANGRTLYLFLADSGPKSACNSSACVQYWPPVLTHGAPQAGTGVSSALLGTTTRADGSTEVTYAGHPLYYFITDRKAGDVTGQGINGFGAPWYVVSPTGMRIV